MKRSETTILGIDPGYADTGFGLLRVTRSSVRHLDSGTIRSEKSVAFPERLNTLSRALDRLIKRYRPDLLAVEQLFFFKNQKTAINVAQARGVVLLAAAKYNLRLAEYTPMQVKQSLTSYGQATKPQVAAMVKRLLAPATLPDQDDAMDALAIALCAHFRSRLPQ